MEGEDGDPPWEWVISRICEEFGCLPSEALDELLDDPTNMALEIMELRAYARAKEMVDTLDEKNYPNNPMIKKVEEIEAELFMEKKREKQRRGQRERKGIDSQTKSRRRTV